MIILQANASSGIISGILTLILLIGLAIYIPKAPDRVKTILTSIVVIFFLLVGIFENAKYMNNLNNPTSLFLVTCSIVVLLYFSYSCFKIYKISREKHKTKQDVVQRTKIVNSLCFIFSLAISFFAVGISFTNIIDLDYHLSVEKWVETTIKMAFFTTMAIVLMDGIISKICSPIHTVEQILHLGNYNLYLRSFEADSIHKKDERFICRTFNHLFPTYAIGDPNTMLQPYGADRIYATDDEWQKAVSDLMLNAQLIIIRCGLTNGTLWEIDKIISSNYINKCVFILDDDKTYEVLKSKFLEIGITPQFPILDFTDNQFGLFLYEDSTGKWNIINKSLKKTVDVECLINDILKINQSIDQEYSKILNIRHKSLRKIFSQDVPSTIKRSLNWGVLSPMINMRHWPIVYWIIFLGLMILGCAICKSLEGCFFGILFAFILGNRIEWTQLPNSSPSLFLKKQHREASLMWFSMISTGVIACLCVLFAFYI